MCAVRVFLEKAEKEGVLSSDGGAEKIKIFSEADVKALKDAKAIRSYAVYDKAETLID